MGLRLTPCMFGGGATAMKPGGITIRSPPAGKPIGTYCIIEGGIAPSCMRGDGGGAINCEVWRESMAPSATILSSLRK